MAAQKKRVSVTLTKPYLEFLKLVVKNGIYLTNGETVMAGLRLLMKEHGFRITPEEAVGW